VGGISKSGNTEPGGKKKPSRLGFVQNKNKKHKKSIVVNIAGAASRVQECDQRRIDIGKQRGGGEEIGGKFLLIDRRISRRKEG